MTKARVNADNASADIQGVTAGTGLSGGGTSGTVSLAVDDTVVATLTGAQLLSNKILKTPEERWTTSATSNASGNWTLNVRGDGSTTLNSILTTGDALTVAFLVTQGGTAYYHTAMTIDGSAVTPKWSGGTAPATGNASSIDAYSFTIVKTADAAFTVLAAGPIKYA